jgi:hypothetical protein
MVSMDGISESITAPIPHSMILDRCFFGLSKTADCLPLESHIYFNLGDLVTVIALLVAVYQLRNFRWDIGLKINRWAKWLIQGLIGLGSVLIIASYILPQLPLDSGAYAYQGLFQFCGFLMLISSVVIYWWAGNYKTLFRKNPSAYVDQLYIRLAQGNPEDLDDIVQTINQDLHDIFRALDGEISSEAEEAAARLFILVFSDNHIVEFLALKRLDFLCRLLYGMQKSGRTDLGRFPESMINALLSDSRSHFFTLRDGQGVYHGFNLYGLLFGESYFHNEHRLLNEVFRRRKNVDLASLADVQIKILETSCRAILVGNVHFDTIGTVFFHLSGIHSYIIGLCRDLNRELSFEEREAIENVLGKYNFFFGHSFYDMYKKCLDEKTLSTTESEARIDETKIATHGRIYAKNLLGQFGISILDYWEALSYVSDRDIVGWHRLPALFAGHQILIMDGVGIPKLNEVFLKVFMQRTRDNVENGHYPALTRIALILFGQAGLGDQAGIRKPYLEYLYKELVPRIQRTQTMSNQNDLMEEALVNSYYTRFNKTTGKLEHKGGHDVWSSIEP